MGGGEGTPEVSEYCAAELGALQGTGMAAAGVLIGDVLDLRYRLPRLWGRVWALRVWRGRPAGSLNRPESCRGMRAPMLIMRWRDLVGMMPWPRFAKILSATIVEADPALAGERAERARVAQDVFSFDSEGGVEDRCGEGGGW